MKQHFQLNKNKTLRTKKNLTKFVSKHNMGQVAGNCFLFSSENHSQLEYSEIDYRYRKCSWLWNEPSMIGNFIPKSMINTVEV